MIRKLVRKLYNPDGVPQGSPELPPVDPNAVPPQPSEATPPAPTPDQGITLSRQEYGELMGQFMSMQQQLQALQTPQTPEPAAPVVNAEDVDRMTNSQLLETILQQVNSQVGQPLLNSIMTLAVKEELRDTQAKYPDFGTYKDEVYREAQANSHLSLEQAYLIVKARKTGTAPPPAPKPAPAPPVGAKPGVTMSATTSTTNLSVKDAAAAALKSLQYD